MTTDKLAAIAAYHDGEYARLRADRSELYAAAARAKRRCRWVTVPLTVLLGVGLFAWVDCLQDFELSVPEHVVAVLVGVAAFDRAAIFVTDAASWLTCLPYDPQLDANHKAMLTNFSAYTEAMRNLRTGGDR